MLAFEEARQILIDAYFLNRPGSLQVLDTACYESERFFLMGTAMEDGDQEWCPVFWVDKATKKYGSITENSDLTEQDFTEAIPCV